MTTRLAALLFASLSLAGCSVTSDTMSCWIHFDGVPDRCIDYTHVDFSIRTGVETTCRGFGGDFSVDKACPTADRVGGCREVGKHGDQIKWFYASGMVPSTRESAMMECSHGGTFVNPDGTSPKDDDLAMPARDLQTPADLATSGG